MRYRVVHQTIYRYSQEVSLSHSLVTCQPRDSERQRCLDHQLRVVPEPPLVLKRRDALGNWVSFFTLEQRHRRLLIETHSRVEVGPLAPLDPPDMSWQEAVAATRAHDPLLEQWRFASPRVSLSAADYAAASFPADGRVMDCVLELNRRIHRQFRYVPGATEVSTPVERVLELGQGVCQDFAHLMLSGLRSRGLAARYVSGYLRTRPPAGQARLIGADASHAWVSVWIPHLGWIDFDPTNDCICDRDHIVLAWGRDYSEVAPVRGVVLGGGQQRISVSVDVQPDSEIFQAGDAFTPP